MIDSIEVIAMVYKSVDYTRFIAQQLANTQENTRGHIDCRIIANDPTDNVLAILDHVSKQHGIGAEIYHDRLPNDYYLNRVYRCWNYCVESSRCSHVCLVNSDMLFNQHWLARLIEHANDQTLPVSLLVESGKLRSGLHAISKNFGRHPNNLQIDQWNEFSAQLCRTNANITAPGGLYMPCIFDRNKFIQAGKFPEGNIYKDGVGTRNGPVVQSGDAWFFDQYCGMFNMQHKTIFDSIVYHIQEGEMDE